MRYAQRGGYTPAEQQRRERLRLQAAGRFARGDGINEIALAGRFRRWWQVLWQVLGSNQRRLSRRFTDRHSSAWRCRLDLGRQCSSDLANLGPSRTYPTRGSDHCVMGEPSTI